MQSSTGPNYFRGNLGVTLTIYYPFQNLKSQNTDLQNFAQNADGILVICLIREFLDYFGLSFTASVFDPELASYGIHCNCKDRIQLIDQLNVASDSTNGNFRISPRS